MGSNLAALDERAPRRALMRRWQYAGMFGAMLLGTSLAACTKCASLARGERRAAEAEPEQKLAPIVVGARELRLRHVAERGHRLILDDQVLAALKRSAEQRTAAYDRVQKRCAGYLARDIPAGYQAFDWSDAMAELALCWHATGEEPYARGALKYLEALLDDRHKLGDQAGGLKAVQADSGYGIRTYAVYAALGYDWLRHAPGMTPELRRRIVQRLGEWLGWYAEKGYLRDEPFSNYFWGYFTALNFAGLAVGDEAPEGRRWLARARDELLSKKVLPHFKARLSGGDWPEGWQYGELVAAEVGLLVRAYRTAADLDLLPVLPWLGEVVQHHTHALLPNGKSVYDGGTWAERPAKPSALGLTGILLALEGRQPQREAEARFLVNELLPPLDRKWAWLALLADRPGAEQRDPRHGAPPSYHVRGSGLSLMRSAWSPDAVFASFKSGPRLAVDHQDKDDGHFELWRGGDGLLVDAGDSEGEATINHNTLLIEDGGRVLTYSPNQGVWGKKQRTEAFGDDGHVAVAVGEFADAYAPACVRQGCSKRAVERVRRHFVFVRPALAVVHDQVELDQKNDQVTWAAHLTVSPERAGGRTSGVVGESRVDVHTIEPERASIAVLKEPTPSGEGPHRANRVWCPTWRIEVKSPTGSKERRFVHWITAAAAETPASQAARVRGEGLRGAEGMTEGKKVAVLFAEDKAGRLTLPGAGRREVVVAGLQPHQSYTLVGRRVGEGCEVKLEPGHGAKPHAGGFLRVEVCGE